jgi:hypothetical protein
VVALLVSPGCTASLLLLLSSLLKEWLFEIFSRSGDFDSLRSNPDKVFSEVGSGSGSSQNGSYRPTLLLRGGKNDDGLKGTNLMM